MDRWSATHLIPPFSRLRVNQITLDAQRLTLLLTTTAPTACCPLCATVATHVHSAYTRTVADLPWAGCTVRVLLTVRTFFCKASHDTLVSPPAMKYGKI